MRLPFSILLAGVLLSSIPAPTIRGQEDKRPPAPEPEPEEERPYVTPPAWKSVEIGDFYLRRKKYRAALSRYQEAAKTDPYNPQAYLGMGRVYDRLGLKQKALENYRKYLDLLPSAKDAEEAREVQKAIVRLERQMKPAKQRSSPPASPAADNSPPR